MRNETFYFRWKLNKKYRIIIQNLQKYLEKAVPVVDIEILKHVKFEIFEWIHRVQTGVAKGEINNVDDLIRDAKTKLLII